MIVEVTIKTRELQLTKVIDDTEYCAEKNVVDAIVALIDAYDAAHNYKSYSVRENLLQELK